MSWDDIGYRLLSSFDYKDRQIKEWFDVAETELRTAAHRIEDEARLVLLQHADESHISRWEDSIQSMRLSSDLEQRRRYLQMLLVSKLKISSGSLGSLVKQFTGADNRVDFNDSVIIITLFRGINKNLMNQFESLMKQVTPAHLYFEINMDYSLDASLNLGNYSLEAIALEVTDQYDARIDVLSPEPFEVGGTFDHSAVIEFTDQYDASYSLDGILAAGSDAGIAELIEFSDAYDAEYLTGSDALTGGAIDHLEIIHIE